MDNTKDKFLYTHNPSTPKNMSIPSQNGNISHAPDPLEKIRYLPSEIKISKSGGKRTASAMCSFQRKQNYEVKLKDDIKHRSVSESTEGNDGNKDEKFKIKSTCSTSSTCSNITFSDVGTSDFPHNNDDVMSTISDVSDISVMSLNPSSLEVSRKYRRQNQYLSTHSKEHQVIKENIVQPNRNFGINQKGLSCLKILLFNEIKCNLYIIMLIISDIYSFRY